MVTHGGVVRVLMKHALGLSIDAPTRFIIKNTGIFGLIWNENWLVYPNGWCFPFGKIEGIHFNQLCAYHTLPFNCKVFTLQPSTY